MSAEKGQVLAPGSVIGILGGGQLGRMSALAAARLGYKVHVFSPEIDGPAAQVAWKNTVAAYDDLAALEAFADAVDVVTFEFENIPAAAAEKLAARKPTRPAPRVLHITQERLREKRFLEGIGVPVTAFREVGSAAELPAAVKAIGTPSILKSASFGYDGKGQVRIDAGTDLDAAWTKMGGSVAILEGFVDFECEISVIVARNPQGDVALYEPARNHHKHHILDTSTVPAGIPLKIAHAAEAIARQIAGGIDLIGLLAVEMFVARDGRVIVNELAPRPHNSGHWSLDGAVTSQFEQHVRAVCGLALGNPARHSDTVMTNLIGDEVETWPQLLADPDVKLHLYGKAEARPGRKMGHWNRLKPKNT
ncbi:5-(carboxyamino)imidazole ribonucleotide synthase [Dongia mobilis]|uniref:N5-carboxyaminoimidazole ribonucleotide synthase n=1 Tax=Dongia mobilis TaxID=578943 RepID=A0A4R6WT89_9PROT|nr:5-(carboxyamino)imidazole ribonucleotide synthase [Dongia mobilis]TDQ83238.1 5-(carboxyamino)imidazole ribonucleotide synthase [Dongia mobilis]